MVHLVGMEKWKYRKWRGDGKVEGQKKILVFSHDVWFGVEKWRNRKLFYLIEKKNKRIENIDYINLVMCPSTKKINLIVYMRKKKKLLVFFLMGKINYQFIYLFIFEKVKKKKTTSLEKQPQ